jgi:hypothetical protein
MTYDRDVAVGDDVLEILNGDKWLSLAQIQTELQARGWKLSDEEAQRALKLLSRKKEIRKKLEDSQIVYGKR